MQRIKKFLFEDEAVNVRKKIKQTKNDKNVENQNKKILISF